MSDHSRQLNRGPLFLLFAADTSTSRPVIVSVARAESLWVAEAGPGKSWLALTLREGRYREVKRLCRAVGLRVLRLVRVAYGPLRLARLGPGEWRQLTPREVATLQDATAPAAAGRTLR